MCGRVAVTDLSEILTDFSITKSMPPSGDPVYNIGPSSPVPVVRSRPDGRRLSFLRWGLIPACAKDASVGTRLINVKVETVAEQPACSEPFRHRRCVIAVSGFFEWARAAETKRPYYITRFDGRPLAMAGLWDLWASSDGEVIESCTIVTKPSVGLIVDIHSRMPAILTPDAVDRWLDGRLTSPESLRGILLAPSPELRAVAVST